MPKSMFGKRARDAEQNAELRRMNEALREKRLISLTQTDKDSVPEIKAKQRAE